MTIFLFKDFSHDKCIQVLMCQSVFLFPDKFNDHVKICMIGTKMISL